MVVPNGWAVKPLLECCDLLQGLTYSPRDVKPYGLIVLRSSNIQDGQLTFDDCVYVNCSVDESRYVKPNDVLVCVRNGSNALIGKSCVIDKAYNATFGAFMSVLRGDTTGYLAHMFASDVVQKQIRNRSSATINQITKRDFEDIKVPIPIDEAEQRAIAAVLSDADALIAALEKLVAKKRAVKQGAMQELLTARRRLTGFEGEWIETMLETVGSFSKGRGISKDEAHSGTIPCVRYGEIYTNHNDYIKEFYSHISASVAATSRRLKYGELLFAGSGETKEEIGKCVAFVSDCEAYAGSDIVILTPNADIDSLFMGYYLNSPSVVEQKASRGQGDAIVHISSSALSKTTISLPPLPEQRLIAAILSDIDADIDALTAKLTKLKQIKQGMMSELLTGHIRLPAEEEGVASAANVVRPKLEVQTAVAPTRRHNQQFDDAVMIAGIVNALYSSKYPLGRKKVQKCLYLLRRHQDESTTAFKKKAAGPYAAEVRYKGGESIAQSAHYIATTVKNKGTIFTRGCNIDEALGYIRRWDKQGDIKWVADKLKYKKVDDLELLTTVDMAICDLQEDRTPVSVASIKHLIATNEEWKAKLKKQTFSDANIARAIRELQILFQGGN